MIGIQPIYIDHVFIEAPANHPSILFLTYIEIYIP